MQTNLTDKYLLGLDEYTLRRYELKSPFVHTKH
jgi:hypothetical protein